MSHQQPQTTSEDSELLQRFIGGDETAFKTLVSRYQKRLYDFVWRQVRNHDDAADLAQNVMIKVFMKATQFRGGSTFKTWLYQIAMNECRNHFRSRGRRRLDDVDPDELPNPEANSVLGTAVTGRDRHLLRAAVDALPDKQRITLQLHLYQECTFEEVAEVLGCPVGTAKANFHHALTALRKKFHRAPGGEL